MLGRYPDLGRAKPCSRRNDEDTCHRRGPFAAAGEASQTA
jgi:hypothetical protein